MIVIPSNVTPKGKSIMKNTRTVLSVMLFVLAILALPMQVKAQSNTSVRAVYSLDVKGNVTEYLKAVKPIIARFKKIQPKSKIHIIQSTYDGTGTGTINIVTDHPSMAYMEKMRIKNENDPELAKLWPTLEKFGVTVQSSGLYLNRAPEQDRDIGGSIEVVYAIDTHGKNDAYVAASKKIHARWNKLVNNATVSVYEAMFVGENSGMIYVVLNYPSMAEMEKIGDIEAGDAELTRLFTERDKIGATVKSLSLGTDVTPK